jgi:chitinase
MKMRYNFAKLILAVFVANFLLHTTLGATNKVICYYESWTNQSHFPPDDIDVSICTHVNFAFLRLNDDGNFRFDDGADDSVLQKFGSLKSTNPDVKLLITLGGWTEDSMAFSHVAADPHKKSTLASTLIHYMQTYNLDGIDIDWEYPGQNGGTPDDKENFVDLLSVVRKALDDNGGGVITVAVSANPDPDSYNVNAISKVVDAIIVMTFDYHGTQDDKTTGENSPLYASSADTDPNANCDASINNWLNSGADPSKLILGLGFYGHVFELTDPEQHAVGSPANGANADYTSYYLICQLADGWTDEWDDEQEVPYKYSNTQWIGYDNSQSVKLKMEYAKSRNLGGVMMWAVNDDDKDAVCGEKNPLLQAIKDNL